jgi:hypothetical protein
MLLDVRPDFAGRPEPNPVGRVLGIVAQSLNLSCADGTLNLGGGLVLEFGLRGPEGLPKLRWQKAA